MGTEPLRVKYRSLHHFSKPFFLAAGNEVPYDVVDSRVRAKIRQIQRHLLYKKQLNEYTNKRVHLRGEEVGDGDECRLELCYERAPEDGA